MEFTNSKGVKYYLHCRTSIIGRNKIPVKTYFFRKEKKDDICLELPEGREVKEMHSGLPIIKKV